MRTILSAVALASFVWGTAPALAGEKDVTLYKNPQCGCCEGYADYLRDNGFTVTTKPTHDLAEMSRQAGIPDEFQGCHLSFIDGYVVSGHVPIDTVEKLLTERPDIAGVTLPGMPLGSPGMSGVKEAPFEMLEITTSGTIGGVYARE
ncbi:MAG: DUF411 domain-containing protein [Candidatus Accumulibacter sp.]|uniref:DUF411 domain-containing protein n=1 Tax=Accumulibacter sp. TaxID=2053492 RepID=UPI0028794155|nr:DUF411 domain-containing protein [Accumulibacter sp.]MDS4015304.1 DUF411 domain-containing protein [Accumulibacter sp.]HRD74379.1 DUF411 domain-containing protein [Hyphomicrobiaceae bacterium]